MLPKLQKIFTTIAQKPLLKLALLLTVAAVVLFFLTKKPAPPPLQVTGYFPTPQETNVSPYANIEITFNRPLATPSEVKVAITPSTETTLTLSENKKTLIITPVSPLHSNQTYHVTVTLAKKQTLLASFSFKTRPLQGDPALIWERDKYIQENYPLIDYLPYETDQFVVYGTSQPFVLEVIVKKGPLDQVKQAVFSWIQSKSLDPTLFQIKWLSLTPTLSP